MSYDIIQITTQIFSQQRPSPSGVAFVELSCILDWLTAVEAAVVECLWFCELAALFVVRGRAGSQHEFCQ